MVGKIARQPLRKVWRSEPEFTRWLVANIDVVSDAIEVTIADAKPEQSAGDFNVDLVGEDGEGNAIIIENQLEKSDHEHLGKLVTYAASLDAKNVVWIVSTPRPEHTGAITWLNSSGLANFYLLKIEAITIGDSDPAPLLTLITGPSEETREAGKTKKELAERYNIRRHFWDTLLKRARHKTRLHDAISPSQYSYVWSGAGKTAIGWRYNVTQHEGEVSLYINRPNEQENRAMLNELQSHKAEIEAEFGAPLVWYKQDGVIHCRVASVIGEGGYRDPEDRWPRIQDAMIDAMVRLERSVRPYLAKIKAE